MADIARHVRIFDPDPSDDLVTKRTAVVKDLASKLVKDRDIDALISATDGVASACVKGGAIPEGMAALVETSIREQSTAFIRAGHELELLTMALLGLDQAILVAAKPGTGLSIGDVVATAAWLALSLQPPSTDPKLEMLRAEVMHNARNWSLSSASRSRLRKPVNEIKIDAFAADLPDASTKIKAALEAPIATLRENAILDREEIDFLWWALGDYSSLLKRQLSASAAPAAAMAAAIEGAQTLRRLPSEGHKHIVMRHVRKHDALALTEMVAALGTDREALLKPIAGERVRKFPAVFGLLATLLRDPAAPGGTGEKELLSEWSARALLEAGFLHVLSHAPGAKI